MKQKIFCFLFFILILISCSKQSGIISTSNNSSTTDFSSYVKYSEIKVEMKDWIQNNFIDKMDNDNFRTYVDNLDSWEDFEADFINQFSIIKDHIMTESNDNPEEDKNILIFYDDKWNKLLNFYTDTNYSIIFNYENLYNAYTSLTSLIKNNPDIPIDFKESEYETKKETAKNSDEQNNYDKTNSKGEVYKLNIGMVYNILDRYFNANNGTITLLKNYNNGDNFYSEVYYNYLIKKKLNSYEIAYIIPYILENEEGRNEKINLVNSEIDKLENISNEFNLDSQLDITSLKTDLSKYLEELKIQYSNSSISITSAQRYFEFNESNYLNSIENYLKINDSSSSILLYIFKIIFYSNDTSTPSIRQQINNLNFADDSNKELISIKNTLNDYYNKIVDDDKNIRTGDYINYASVILKIIEAADLIFDSTTQAFLRDEWNIKYY